MLLRINYASLVCFFPLSLNLSGLCLALLFGLDLVVLSACGAPLPLVVPLAVALLAIFLFVILLAILLRVLFLAAISVAALSAARGVMVVAAVSVMGAAAGTMRLALFLSLNHFLISN